MLCECCGCYSSNRSNKAPDLRCGEITVLSITITALVIGIIGMLIYTGHLQMGWSSVGAISQLTGLYTMLTGFIITFIASILIIIIYYRHRQLRSSMTQAPNGVTENVSPPTPIPQVSRPTIAHPMTYLPQPVYPPQPVVVGSPSYYPPPSGVPRIEYPQ